MKHAFTHTTKRGAKITMVVFQGRTAKLWNPETGSAAEVTIEDGFSDDTDIVTSNSTPRDAHVVERSSTKDGGTWFQANSTVNKYLSKKIAAGWIKTSDNSSTYDVHMTRRRLKEIADATYEDARN